MGSSKLRRTMRLQTGVTKMVCHLVDWPVSRGGRCFTWAARKQMKGLKSPSERKNPNGLWFGISNRAAKFLTCSYALSECRINPPPLPPRPGRNTKGPPLPPRPVVVEKKVSCRKLRREERKFNWCTERANWFFSRNQHLAGCIIDGKPFRDKDWYVKSKSAYHSLRRHKAISQLRRDDLTKRSFFTIGQIALTHASVVEFTKVFLAYGYEWDRNFIDTDMSYCICTYLGPGRKIANIGTCRVHKHEYLRKCKLERAAMEEKNRRRKMHTPKKRGVSTTSTR